MKLPTLSAAELLPPTLFGIITLISASIPRCSTFQLENTSSLFGVFDWSGRTFRLHLVPPPAHSLRGSSAAN
eukprot:COSAG01_NODE_1675_length_9535_cov_6.782959_1_plen_72_part_00